MNNKHHINLYYRGFIWSIKNLKKIRSFIGKEQENDKYFSLNIEKNKKKLNIEILPFEELLGILKINYNHFDISEKKPEDWNLNGYELVILKNIYLSKSVKKIFEIGTFKGETAMNLFNVSKKEIYTMDLPQNLVNKLKPSFKVGEYLTEESKKWVHQIYADSTKFDYSNFLGKIDLFIIDGCHEYFYAKKDTINAIKCISDGGIVVWHDFGNFNMTKKGIMDGILESKKKFKSIYQIAGTSFLIGIT